MINTSKTWADLFQGFFSREFIMHLAAFLFGGMLLWRNEGSDMGAVLVMGAVGAYGVIRTTQKVVDARETTKRNVSADTSTPLATPPPSK